MDMKSFGLSCENVQDKDDWRLDNQEGNWLTQVNLEKQPLKWVHVCMNEEKGIKARSR